MSEPSPALQTTDSELVKKVAAGDPEALGELFDRYAPDVWRAVHRLNIGAVDVEGVVCAVFVELPRVAHSYDERRSCRHWLCEIALRRALCARGRFDRLVVRLVACMRTLFSRPKRDALWGARIHGGSSATHVLDGLDEMARAVFLLVYADGFSIDEASRALVLSRSVVRAILAHARDELSTSLSPPGS
jgi:RNA polymerase sigma-70 factor (ECF subfamily)